VDGLYLCDSCLHHLERLIAEMPAMYEDLSRQVSSGSSGPRVSGSSSARLPINPTASEHQCQIVGVLASWCKLVADERGIATPAGPEVWRTAPWLTVHVTWCAANPWVDEMLAELRQLAGRARSIADPTRKLPTGERCRTVFEDGERCDGSIVMQLDRDDCWTAWCPECGPHAAADYLHDSISGRWVTIERAEVFVSRVHGRRVARSTIRSWVSRGHIRSQDQHGKTWYELSSLERYLAPRRERVGSGA
jgi:hypothetical protein